MITRLVMAVDGSQRKYLNDDIRLIQDLANKLNESLKSVKVLKLTNEIPKEPTYTLDEVCKTLAYLFKDENMIEALRKKLNKEQ